jgi:hypothetical protein
MTKLRIHPTTIDLSVLPVYRVLPLITRLRDTEISFFEEIKSLENFQYASKNLYQPILQFILKNGISTNIIITGQFLDWSRKRQPKNLTLLKKVLHNNQAHLILDAYHGNSLTALYNSDWWIESLRQTQQLVQTHLGINPNSVHLPQLYRSLDIERLVWELGLDVFIIRQKGRKSASLEHTLSELRTIDRQVPPWIVPEKDHVCQIRFIPDTTYFDVNESQFEPDIHLAAKTLSMAIGFADSQFVLKNQSGKLKEGRKFRIGEKPNITMYNPLQKAVIRLWEYCSFTLMSHYNYNPGEPSRKLFEAFSMLQNTDYLNYLEKSNYFNGKQLNFSSPYEAFVNMQSTIKQIEVILKNQL